MPFQLDIMQFPAWFMAVAIVVLCIYTGMLHRRQEKSMEKRDALLDTIAKVIWGSDSQEGLKTRVSLVEDRVERCAACSNTYSEHSRDHEDMTHVHIRHADGPTGKTIMHWNKNGSMERVIEDSSG